jgi:signal peptidase I
MTNDAIRSDPQAGHESTPNPPRRFTGRTDDLLDWVKTLASASVYATLILTFVGQSARVDGLSMEPTLADQDRLVVNKWIYRFSEPRSGDIVMLYYPADPEKLFVKRVIAREGDDVRITSGKVYVNGVALFEEFVPPEYRSHEDFGPLVVPQGYYFVMGDHRNGSSDSRIWGEVPKKYIIGRVQVRWWPLPDARTF